IARFASDGTLDASFGTGGVVLVDPTTDDDEITSIVNEPDGGVLVLGISNVLGSGSNPSATFLMRFDNMGTIVSSFGTNGTVWFPTAAPDLDGGLALYPDGRIVANAGYVVRMNADGTPDDSFGTNGQAPYSALYSFRIGALYVTSDGDVLVGAGPRSS